MRILILLLLLSTAASAQKRPLYWSITGNASVVLKDNLVHYEASVGIIKPKVGGVFIGAKQYQEPAGNGAFFTRTKIIVSYYHSIQTGKRTMVAPYVTIGRRYSEAGVTGLYQLRPELQLGLRSGATNQGFYVGVAFFGVQHLLTKPYTHGSTRKNPPREWW